MFGTTVTRIRRRRRLRALAAAGARLVTSVRDRGLAPLRPALG
jgi:hypothetical protein